VRRRKIKGAEAQGKNLEILGASKALWEGGGAFEIFEKHEIFKVVKVKVKNSRGQEF